MGAVSWKSAVSADWSVAGDWSTNTVPNDAAGDFVQLNAPGTYSVSIAAGESFSVQNVTVATGLLFVAGTLTLANNSAVSAGATIAGSGIITGSGAMLNGGVIVSNVPSGLLNIGVTGFSNVGTLMATSSGRLFLTSPGFTNLSGNTLTGGVYEVDGPAFGILSELLIGIGNGGASEVITNNATIVLNGEATNFAGYNGGTRIRLESSLTAIGSSGVLSIIGGRDYLSAKAIANLGTLNLAGGTFSDSQTLTSSGLIRGFGNITAPLASTGTLRATGGLLTLTNTLADTGSFVVDADAGLSLTGTYGQPIVNNGYVQAQGDLLKITGAVTGSGGFVINSPTAAAPNSFAATLELASAFSGPVAFNGPAGILRLDTPANFSGAIVGFGQGDFAGRPADTIDVVGIVANAATLVGSNLQLLNNGTLAYTLAMSGNYSGPGVSFNAASDGAGGTNVTVQGLFARDYALEGPYWHSKTITWSFATTNIAGDSAQFSHFFTTGTLPGDTRDQTQYQSVIQQAFAKWASIAGFNFVQVADSAAADLRIGWANFPAGGEIGRADYSFQTDTMLAGSIIRLEDPTNIALDDSPGITGGLVYHNLSSTMYQVALHEIGHSLGLGHSTDLNAVMYPSAGGTQNQEPNFSDIAGMTTLYAAVACFAAGARLATARGEIKVEVLQPGDLVQGLVSGLQRRVRWIGHRRLELARHPRPQDVQPVCICADAFGPGLPRRALRLSPDHAVLIEGALVPVRYLVNGASIRQERARSVQYFHVELEDMTGNVVHDVLSAEGLPVESYLDTGNRGAFANADAPLQLHPQFARGIWAASGCAPLQLGGALVANARQQLLLRAPDIGFPVSEDPDLRIVGRSASRPAFEHNAHTWRFDAPRGGLRLRSRTAIPAEMRAADTDHRRLGVAVARIALDGKVIPLDDVRLGAGFFAVENSERRRWRWTDGNAHIRLDRPGRLDVTLAFTLPYWVRPAVSLAGTTIG